MKSEILPAATAEKQDLIDITTVCRLLGGIRPLNAATVYRQIATGALPGPIKVSPMCARWFRHEIAEAIAARAAARHVKAG